MALAPRRLAHLLVSVAAKSSLKRIAA